MPTAPARTPHIRAKLSGKRSTALDLERKRTHVLAPFKRIPPVATKKHSSSRSSSRVPRSSPRSSSSGRQSAPASEIIDTEGVADGDEFIDTEGIDTEGIDTEGIDTEGALNEESLDAESVTDDADSDADSEDPDDDGGELGTAGIDLMLRWSSPKNHPLSLSPSGIRCRPTCGKFSATSCSPAKRNTR